MTVWVDDARIPAKVGRISSRWSHLTATTEDELHAFAARLGLQRRWYQTCRNTRLCPPAQCPHWHYDVTDGRRAAAIQAGAVPIGIRDLGELIRARRRGEAWTAPAART